MMWSGIIFYTVNRNHHVSTLQKYLQNYFSNKVFIWLHYIYGRQDSVVGTELTRGWTVQGLDPSEGNTFQTYPDQLQEPSNLLYNGYQVSFPGVERPGWGTDSLTSVHY